MTSPVQDAEPSTEAPTRKGSPEAEQGAHISRPGPASTKPCRWCADGHKLIEGEHWVVRGIGRISLKPCKASPR